MNELEHIEGIGPKTKELLEKLQIFTIEDLVNNEDKDYMDYEKNN